MYMHLRMICTHHIYGVDVRKLREELTTAEGELGVGFEELLSGETKQTQGRANE